LLLVRRLAMRESCASVRFGVMGVNIISLPPPSGYEGETFTYASSWKADSFTKP